MSTNPAKSSAKAKRRRPSVAGKSGTTGRTANKGGVNARSDAHVRPRRSPHPFVFDENGAGYVLVPVDDYERLVKTDMLEKAIAKLDRKESDFVDADDLALDLASTRIAGARKAAGLTQKQLGDKLKLPQSQISRIERNPDRTTIRTLKRVARALGVDLRALV